MAECSAGAARGLASGPPHEHSVAFLFAAGTEGLSPQDRGMDGGCTHCPAPGEGCVSERLLLCRETTWSRAGGGDQGGRHQAEV